MITNWYTSLKALLQNPSRRSTNPEAQNPSCKSTNLEAQNPSRRSTNLEAQNPSCRSRVFTPVQYEPKGSTPKIRRSDCLL